MTVFKNSQIAHELLNAKTTDEAEIALNKFAAQIAEDVKTDYEALFNASVSKQRGVRNLSTKETKFYEKLVSACKDSNPKQKVEDLINVDGGMPETIIEDVYTGLVQEHPLLQHIEFRDVKYMTRWILSDNDETSKAVWGKINKEITEQLEASFKVVDLVQNKLTAFFVVPNDMLDLGAQFIHAYVIQFLKEALALGLENGIINGKGGDTGEPVGLIRDIHKGVSVTSGVGYPKKAAIKVKSFGVDEYGKVLSKMAVRENGAQRNFTKVVMVVSPVTYLEKVMGATTQQVASGGYVNQVFPFPTEVITSVACAKDEAIIFVEKEYFFGVGTSKDGSITYSDEFKWLDDARTFKIKMHGCGMAYDNTSALLLDVSELEPFYFNVKNVVPVA